MLLQALLLIFIWANNVSAGFIRGQRYFSSQHPKHEGDLVQSLAAAEEDLDEFSLPSRCLEDPDGDEECRRKLRKLQRITIPTDTITVEKSEDGNNHAASSSSAHRPPHSYITDFDGYGGRMYGATSAPTKDMCYGNMARLNKKFCYSEMPSVSLEPSEQPTVYTKGGSSGGGSGGDGVPTRDGAPAQSFQPTVMASTGPSVADSPEVKPSSKPSSSPFDSLSPSLVPSDPSPSPSPTHRHEDEPSLSPSNRGAPSSQPSSFPPSTSTAPSGLGQCQGDCDTDEDCETGLYCFHRDAYQAIPGCPNLESDASRTDYCTGVTLPPVTAPNPSPTDDICRLKLYWNASYYWQESSEEANWCMICGNPNYGGQTPPTCQEGDNLYIRECGWDSTYFEFIGGRNNTNNIFSTMIRAEGTNLCLEWFPTGGLEVTLEICDNNNDQQHWMTGDLPISCETVGTDEFEIVQDVEGEDFCLTTHHHPKHGEEVELFPCRAARRDFTSLWTAE